MLLHIANTCRKYVSPKLFTHLTRFIWGRVWERDRQQRKKTAETNTANIYKQNLQCERHYATVIIIITMRNERKTRRSFWLCEMSVSDARWKQNIRLKTRIGGIFHEIFRFRRLLFAFSIFLCPWRWTLLFADNFTCINYHLFHSNFMMHRASLSNNNLLFKLSILLLNLCDDFSVFDQLERSIKLTIRDTCLNGINCTFEQKTKHISREKNQMENWMQSKWLLFSYRKSNSLMSR